MCPNTHRHPSPDIFTHHPYTDTCPIPFHPSWSPIFTHTHPMGPNTVRHLSPHALCPNPFTHGSNTHSQTPIPTCPSPITHTQTPAPIPFHPWHPIFTHTHPLNCFTHGPKYCQTPIPTPPLHMAQRQTPIPRPFLPHTHVHTICSSLTVTFCDGLIVMVCGAFNHDDFVMACHSSCNVL